MTHLKPTDKIPGWEPTNAECRIIECLTMLSAHGFMAEEEWKAVRARIEAWRTFYEN